MSVKKILKQFGIDGETFKSLFRKGVFSSKGEYEMIYSDDELGNNRFYRETCVLDERLVFRSSAPHSNVLVYDRGLRVFCDFDDQQRILLCWNELDALYLCSVGRPAIAFVNLGVSDGFPPPPMGAGIEAVVLPSPNSRLSVNDRINIVCLVRKLYERGVNKVFMLRHGNIFFNSLYKCPDRSAESVYRSLTIDEMGGIDAVVDLYYPFSHKNLVDAVYWININNYDFAMRCAMTGKIVPAEFLAHDKVLDIRCLLQGSLMWDVSPEDILDVLQSDVLVDTVDMIEESMPCPASVASATDLVRRCFTLAHPAQLNFFVTMLLKHLVRMVRGYGSGVVNPYMFVLMTQNTEAVERLEQFWQRFALEKELFSLVDDIDDVNGLRRLSSENMLLSVSDQTFKGCERLVTIKQFLSWEKGYVSTSDGDVWAHRVGTFVGVYEGGMLYEEGESQFICFDIKDIDLDLFNRQCGLNVLLGAAMSLLATGEDGLLTASQQLRVDPVCREYIDQAKKLFSPGPGKFHSFAELDKKVIEASDKQVIVPLFGDGISIDQKKKCLTACFGPIHCIDVDGESVEGWCVVINKLQ